MIEQGGQGAPWAGWSERRQNLRKSSRAHWNGQGSARMIRFVPTINRTTAAAIARRTELRAMAAWSVGVQHQYCGQLGKQANCQVVVTLSIANHHASLPIAYRLYLPEEWAKDAARRKKARVPKAITFKTKPEIALEQIRKAYAAGVPRGAVLIDASYGSNSALRTGISALGLKYVAAIIPTVKVRRVSDRGASDERLSAKELALSVIFSTSTK